MELLKRENISNKHIWCFSSASLPIKERGRLSPRSPPPHNHTLSHYFLSLQRIGGVRLRAELQCFPFLRMARKGNLEAFWKKTESNRRKCCAIRKSLSLLIDTQIHLHPSQQAPSNFSSLNPIWSHLNLPLPPSFRHP